MQHLTNQQIEQEIGARILPVTLLAPQFFESLGGSQNLDPVKRLMIAVLQEAMVDFEANVSAKGWKKRNLFREAKDWIFDESRDWIFSFENICEVLGLDPDYVRGRLLLWSARKLATS
jgi:hypothetical protein